MVHNADKLTETAIGRPNAMREDAVGLLPPGLADASYRLDRTLEAHLKPVFTTPLRSSAQSVELLLWSHPAHVMVTLHTSTTPTHAASSSGGSGGTETAGDETLATRCVSALPEWCGVVRGQLTLAPLGWAALPTARLLKTDATATLEVPSLLRSVLRYNHDRGIPTLLQLLVEPAGRNQYELILRVAAVHSTPPPCTRNAVAELLTRSPQDALAAILPDGFASSRQLVRDYWTTVGTHSDATLGIRPQSGPTATPAAERALQLATSAAEYAALLNGRPASSLYDALDCAPTVTVSADQLRELLAVFPVYSGCAWPTSDRRGPPQVSVDETYQEPAATSNEIIHDADEIPTATTHGPEQLSVQSFLYRWLTDRGNQPTIVEERTMGDPHLRGHHEHQEGPVVIVNPQADPSDSAITSAGELIAAANQAVRAAQHLVVVTPSMSAARWAQDILTVPYATRNDDDTIRPYTVPASVDTSRGAIVTRRTDPPPAWSVTPNGRRNLWLGDRCVATNTVAIPPGVDTYSTPSAIPTDDGVLVRDADNNTLETYSTTDALTDTYRIVPRPILPVWPTFIATSTVLVRDGIEITEPPQPPRWADRCEGQLLPAQKQAALAEFIDTYTASSRAPSDGVVGFESVVRSWADEQCMLGFGSGTQLARHLPKRVSATIGTDGTLTQLRNREWVFPTEALWLQEGDFPS